MHPRYNFCKLVTTYCVYGVHVLCLQLTKVTSEVHAHQKQLEQLKVCE